MASIDTPNIPLQWASCLFGFFVKFVGVSEKQGWNPLFLFKVSLQFATHPDVGRALFMFIQDYFQGFLLFPKWGFHSLRWTPHRFEENGGIIPGQLEQPAKSLMSV